MSQQELDELITRFEARAAGIEKGGQALGL
jgi:hypothetical protein